MQHICSIDKGLQPAGYNWTFRSHDVYFQFSILQGAYAYVLGPISSKFSFQN